MSQKLNASQRLETLEVNNQEILMHLNQMARDIMILKEAVKMMGNKLSAVQKATGVTDETVNSLMVQNNVDELKEKVDGFKANGTLVDAAEVSETSFVVGREVNDAGETVNPRVQFAVSGLNNDELKAKVLGAKMGDTVSFSEGTLKLTIEEVYAIVLPKLEEPSEAAPVEA